LSLPQARYSSECGTYQAFGWERTIVSQVYPFFLLAHVFIDYYRELSPARRIVSFATPIPIVHKPIESKQLRSAVCVVDIELLSIVEVIQLFKSAFFVGDMYALLGLSQVSMQPGAILYYVGGGLGCLVSHAIALG